MLLYWDNHLGVNQLGADLRRVSGASMAMNCHGYSIGLGYWMDSLAPFENMRTKLVNEAASKTSDIAGDGTTTAAVLLLPFLPSMIQWVQSCGKCRNSRQCKLFVAI